jgi:hypothetical protein
MGIFNWFQKKAADAIYDDVKELLKPKDGFVHVIMINSFSKILNQHFGCEDKYTVQLDAIITSMQKDGYEIVDIKFNSLRDQGLFISFMEGFHTLIIYR